MNIDFIINIFVVLIALFWIISLIMVFSNQDSSKYKSWLHEELLGGLEMFFTKKYLNDKGRKWQPYLAFSTLVLIVIAVISYIIDK